MRASGRVSCAAIAVAASLAPLSARADDVLSLGAPTVDPPTLVAIGVRAPVIGDDNHNARVDVRVRPMGGTFRDAFPLHRVRADVITGFAVPEQFAGSVVDLAPGTTYEIELHATDPDGAVDTTTSVMATTRSVPGDPAAPHAVMVTDAASLAGALAAAQPGDVITLANGTYAGNFAIDASGTADAPIVIRGDSADGVVLDGQGCTGCNVLEVYGSFVHVEKMTIAHASRALRFQGAGAEGNVVRRVKIEDVTLGIGSKQDQEGFYICDNELAGRLAWPAVYADDGGLHANDDGIHVEGNGHVVCHNRIAGFGDAMKVEEDGAIANDFYGNDVLSAYDNGVELDASQGNVRCFQNRFTDTYATISVQPIYGGPAYIYRNVVVNVANEQLKFHANGTNEPSGVYVFHNTFVSPAHALSLQTSATSHHFAFADNLFVGPASPDQTRTVDWTGPIDDGVFDHDGYFPDARFSFDLGGTYTTFDSFAELQAGGLEANGRIVEASPFASGVTPPGSYTTNVAPADVTPAATSVAIDGGVAIPGFDDGYQGAAPDLGAIETGCTPPIYGVRPDGVDETNEPFGCGSLGSGGGGGASSTSTGSGTASNGAGTGATAGAGGSGGGASSGGDDSGCGCRVESAGDRDVRSPAWIALAAIALGFAKRRSGSRAR